MGYSSQLTKLKEEEDNQKLRHKRKAGNNTLKDLKVALKGRGKDSISQKQRNDFIDALMEVELGL